MRVWGDTVTQRHKNREQVRETAQYNVTWHTTTEDHRERARVNANSRKGREGKDSTKNAVPRA